MPPASDTITVSLGSIAAVAREPPARAGDHVEPLARRDRHRRRPGRRARPRRARAAAPSRPLARRRPPRRRLPRLARRADGCVHLRDRAARGETRGVNVLLRWACHVHSVVGGRRSLMPVMADDDWYLVAFA